MSGRGEGGAERVTAPEDDAQSSATTNFEHRPSSTSDKLEHRGFDTGVVVVAVAPIEGRSDRRVVGARHAPALAHRRGPLKGYGTAKNTLV